MNWPLAVERTVTGLGYELVDLKKTAGGLLQVFIDCPPDSVPKQEAVTVEDCEKVTRQLQYVLEVENCLYERLEVSSPGLDRPLKKVSDYIRFSGEYVEISLKSAFLGRKKYLGFLQSVSTDEGQQFSLILDNEQAKNIKNIKEAEDDSQFTLRFTIDEIQEARLCPVFNFKSRSAGKKDN